MSLASNDFAAIPAGSTALVIGNSGAGSVLDKIIIVPGTLAAGSVSIQDGSGAAISLFVAGTLSDLKPITIILGARSIIGAWKITTGTNVTAIAVGRFLGNS